MSERGTQLRETADGQISELIGLLFARGEAVLSLSCPGRETMGDGTVGACALHTADRYRRIAQFLQTAAQMVSGPAGGGRHSHRIPRFLLACGHRPSSHAESGHEQGVHSGDYTAQDVDRDGILKRLSAGRDAFSLLSELTDEQLDTVPPAGSFRFCDGQRTLEQVLAGLLKHQSHQIDAMKAAVG
jgi:hypothetical protein